MAFQKFTYQELKEKNLKPTIPKEYFKIINQSMRRIHLPPTFAPEVSREKFLILDAIFFYRYKEHQDFPAYPEIFTVLFSFAKEKAEKLIDELLEEEYIFIDEVERKWFDQGTQVKHESITPVYKLNFNKVFPSEVRKLYDKDFGTKFVP